MTASEAFSPVSSQSASSASSTQTDTASSPSPLRGVQRSGYGIPGAGGSGKLPLPREAGGVGVDLVGPQKAGYRRRDDLPRPFLLTADRQHHRKIGRDELGVEPSGLVLLLTSAMAGRPAQR